MKFDELSLDCLESVLEYLELTDLLNVADSTKRLRKAAQLVYARKYGNKMVKLENIRIAPYLLNKIEIGLKTLLIFDFKIALQLMRCVGKNVIKMNIQFLHIHPNEMEIERELKIDSRLFMYINDYCAEFLEHILIYTVHAYLNNPMEHFVTPFVSIRGFTHCDYNFTENVRLDRLFPNLEDLKSMHSNNDSFFRFNTNHFPHLKKFAVAEMILPEPLLRNEMVTAFLQLNPQITHLLLTSFDFRVSNLNIDLIRNAVDCLQNVEFLSLQINPISSIEASDNIIRMKSVELFKINFNLLEELPEHFLPFVFERLVRFIIWFPKKELLTSFQEEFFNFIEKHPKISILTIQNIQAKNLDWSRLATYLPLLARIQLWDCFFSIDEVIELMQKFRMLKEFKFKLNGDFSSLRERLGYTWEGTYDSTEELVTLKSRYKTNAM